MDPTSFFNVGASTNAGSGALAQTAPMITASNNYQNAMQQLAMARLLNSQSMSSAGLAQSQLKANNYLQSLQPGPLNYLALGLSGVNALNGLNMRNNVQNLGYVPNPALPVPGNSFPIT